jgi:hypothetical protein
MRVDIRADEAWRYAHGMLHTFIVATAVFTSPPPLSFSPIPDRLAPFGTVFSKHIDVFGTHVFATRATPDAKVTHAAAVLAQWLDNNEDGVPDSPEVAAAMAGRDAYLFMTADEREMNRLHYQVEKTLAPWGLLQWGQFLHGSETNPGDGRFDAAIEETLHLVCTAGWAQVWPDIFGPRPGTAISNCCDAARGGRFAGPPRRYPATAWFTYDDKTCEYDCMVVEYEYWAITSLLGGQQSTGRCEEIEHEWRLCSPEQVRARDAAVVTLLSDPAYKLPTRLPDGDYGAEPQSDAFFLDALPPPEPRS